MSIEPVLPSEQPDSSVDGRAGGPDEVVDAVDVGGLWDPERRPLVVGLVLTITLVAFEALAIATVMPEVKDELGGLGLYGWVFSGFFLASLLGIVVSGQLADRHGLFLPYAAGLGLFAAGLVIGGAAQSMPILIVGRCLQGFGAGAIPATAYVAIARGIPAPLRPRMFAVTSTAWVVPGLVGPGAALAIEHATSWRFVFLLLVPLVVIAGSLTAPALRSLGKPEPSSEPVDAEAEAAQRAHDRHRVRQVILLVAGIAAVFAASSAPSAFAAALLVVVGAPVAARSVVRLLPRGTMRLAPGVPATVALRGILTFAFFSADAYVPLAIIDGRDGASWIAGAALTLCTMSWTAGSWVQERWIERQGPRRLDQIGFGVLLVSVLALIVMAQGGPPWLAIVSWGTGGFAIGLAYAPQAVTVLASAAPGEEGSASAAIQLSDALGIALGTGFGGAVVALGDGRGWSVASSVTVVFVVAALVAVAGLLASHRLPETVPAQAT